MTARAGAGGRGAGGRCAANALLSKAHVPPAPRPPAPARPSDYARTFGCRRRYAVCTRNQTLSPTNAAIDTVESTT